jgi:hypothetical protein
MRTISTHSLFGMGRAMTYQEQGSPRLSLRAECSRTFGAAQGNGGFLNSCHDITSTLGTSTVTRWVLCSAPTDATLRSQPSGRSHSQVTVTSVPSSNRQAQVGSIDPSAMIPRYPASVVVWCRIIGQHYDGACGTWRSAVEVQQPLCCRSPVSPSRWASQAQTGHHRSPRGENHRPVQVGSLLQRVAWSCRVWTMARRA